AGLDRIGRTRDPRHLAVDADIAGIRLIEAEQDRHEGRLAGAILTYNAVDGALLDLERDVLIGVDRAETLVDMGKRDGGGRRHRVSVSHDRSRSVGPGGIRHVVVDLYRARLDVGLCLVNGRLHLIGDQRLVVVVERPADAAFGKAEDGDARLEGAILTGLEHVVGRDIDPLQHGGQHMTRMQAVLIGIDTDAELAGIRRRLQHPDAGATGSVIDDVGAAIELRFREFAALDGIVPGRTGRAGHVLEDLVILFRSLYTADIAASETA